MVVVAPTCEELPKLSWVWEVLCAEHVPATSVCAAETIAIFTGVPALMISTWVPLVRPLAEAVRVGVPDLVSLKKKLAAFWPAAMVTEAMAAAQRESES